MPTFSTMLLRRLKIALIVSVAAWGLVGALGNLLDWSGTKGAVAAVASMSQFEGGAGDWRATQSMVVILSGALFIVLFKSATAGLALAGAVAMWRALGSDAASFAQAKALGLAGCLVGVFGLFTGWIVIGEGWYEFWRDQGMMGLEGAGFAAFRYGGFIALIGLLVAQPET